MYGINAECAGLMLHVIRVEISPEMILHLVINLAKNKELEEGFGQDKEGGMSLCFGGMAHSYVR